MTARRDAMGLWGGCGMCGSTAAVVERSFVRARNPGTTKHGMMGMFVDFRCK